MPLCDDVCEVTESVDPRVTSDILSEGVTGCSEGGSCIETI